MSDFVRHPGNVALAPNAVPNRLNLGWVVAPDLFDLAEEARFAGLVDRHLSAGAATIRVELAHVSYIDSSGVRALLHAKAEAERRGAAIVLVDPTPYVAQMLGRADVLLQFDVEMTGA